MLPALSSQVCLGHKSVIVNIQAHYCQPTGSTPTLLVEAYTLLATLHNHSKNALSLCFRLISKSIS